MNSQKDYSHRPVSVSEQLLYDHLINCANQETPEQLIQRFHQLFIEGARYPDRQIVNTLDHIVADPRADGYFHHILNRCCYILINRWQVNRHYQVAIADLISLFEKGPTHGQYDTYRLVSAQRVRKLVAQFSETEEYLRLKRLKLIISQSLTQNHQSLPLGTLIGQYPYLYEHALVTKTCSLEYREQVRCMQQEAQRRFEVDLSHYVTYRVRRRHLHRQGTLTQQAAHMKPASNPTLLSDRELVAALRQFTNKAKNYDTYQDLAQRFLTERLRKTTYGTFKDDFFEYITASIDAQYSKRQFGNHFYQYLKDTYPASNQQPLNDFLLLRTCSQAFNFLVIDPTASRQHYTFIDLINNLGPLVTTSILLKILLLCRQVKPYLDKQLSMLFNHYESVAQSSVNWLVKMLETVNVALSLNFGTVDLSHALWLCQTQQSKAPMSHSNSSHQLVVV